MVSGEGIRQFRKGDRRFVANLITNKHKKLEFVKKPSGFLKRLSARKLRREAIRELLQERPEGKSVSKKHADRKRSSKCPICLHRLQKNKKRSRYVNRCDHCHAQLNPMIRCLHCRTFRVWTSPNESRCKGCGKLVSFEKDHTPA